VPWMETSPMQTRNRFVADGRLGLYSRSELCTRYGTSRKTGDKWLTRYQQENLPGLRGRSHRPHHARTGPCTATPQASATNPPHYPSPRSSPSRLPRALPYKTPHRVLDH